MSEKSENQYWSDGESHPLREVYNYKDWKFAGQFSGMFDKSWMKHSVFVSARVNKKRDRIILSMLGHNGNREIKVILDLNDIENGFKPFLMEDPLDKKLGRE